MNFIKPSLRYWPIVVVIAVVAAFTGIQIYNSQIGPGAIENCKKQTTESVNDCYSKLILNVFNSRGLNAALDQVAKIAGTDKTFAETCHQTMHDLGVAEYKVYQKTGKITPSDKFSYCNYGFYHSFMEAMVTSTGGVESAKQFCDKLGTFNMISNCYHGIGHGLSSEPETTGNAFEMSLPGLKVCRELPEDHGYRKSCQTGVFNSIVILYDNPKYKLIKPDNAYTLCLNKSYTQGEKSACYLEMATLSIELRGGDLNKEFDEAKIVGPDDLGEVLQDLALYSVPGHSAQEILDVCVAKAADYMVNCVPGVAYGLKVYGDLGKEYQPVIDYYRNNNMSESEKKLFLETALKADVNSPEEQRAVCNKFPEDMRIGPCVGI